VKNLIHCVCFIIFLVGSAQGDDPLASEIAKWKKFIETNASTSEDWKSIREGAEPLLERAEKALAAGHRNFALHLLSFVDLNM